MALNNLLFDLKNPNFALWSLKHGKDFTKNYSKTLAEDKTVIWDITATAGATSDHIEMAGFLSAIILCYGKDKNGNIRLSRHLKVPTLRKKPDVTQSSFGANFAGTTFKVYENGVRKAEKPQTVEIKGTLKMISACGDLKVTREFFAPRSSTSAMEKVTVENIGNASQKVKIVSDETKKRLSERHCMNGAIEYGSYTTAPTAETELKKNETLEFYCVYYAVKEGDKFSVNCEEQYNARKAFVDEMFTSIRVESNYPLLDALFSHCVLRGSESIYETSSGLMHGPGGGNYYAALWTNDQCEYANPFFPYSGYEKAIEQSVNCYRLYEKYMDRSDKPMSEKERS